MLPQYLGTYAYKHQAAKYLGSVSESFAKQAPEVMAYPCPGEGDYAYDQGWEEYRHLYQGEGDAYGGSVYAGGYRQGKEGLPGKTGAFFFVMRLGLEAFPHHLGTYDKQQAKGYPMVYVAQQTSTSAA